MVVATYKENRKSAPEHIRVHKYSDGTYHIEAITNSYAKGIGGTFTTLEEVETFLNRRNRFRGYSLIIKR